MVMVSGLLVSFTSFGRVPEAVLPSDGFDEGSLSGRMVVVTKWRPDFLSLIEGLGTESAPGSC